MNLTGFRLKSCSNNLVTITVFCDNRGTLTREVHQRHFTIPQVAMNLIDVNQKSNSITTRSRSLQIRRIRKCGRHRVGKSYPRIRGGSYASYGGCYAMCIDLTTRIPRLSDLNAGSVP